MGHVPVRRSQIAKSLTAFTVWLAENGAEIGVPTNPYEVLRYRAYWRDTRTAGVHIIYAKENGLLTWTGGSLGHFRAFLAGGRIVHESPELGPVKQPEGSSRDARPKKKKIKTSQDLLKGQISARHSPKAPTREELLQRDGSDCWFCGNPLNGDATIEHLVPKSKGGVNHIDNYVLAHGACNLLAADKPLVEKIALRTELRAKQPIATT